MDTRVQSRWNTGVEASKRTHTDGAPHQNESIELTTPGMQRSSWTERWDTRQRDRDRKRDRQRGRQSERASETERDQETKRPRERESCLLYTSDAADDM
eukprot:507260-Rhodomonas_salina.2